MLNLNQIDEMYASGQINKADGKSVLVNHVRESNKTAVRRALWESPEIKWMRESFHKKWGFDFADKKKFPVMEAGFNWQKVAQKCGYPSLDMAFKEADSGSNFVGVLRAGVQTIVNSMYETVSTSFESWVTTVASKRDTELYAPLHGISFLREVAKQGLYPESRAAGLDIKLKNRKYGTMYAVEKELLEDDQTGQFQQQAGLLGEYAKLAIECIVYAKLAGTFSASALANYGGLEVPATETQPSEESTYPWSTALVGGGANRPGSFGAFNNANVQSGFIALMNQKNKLGLKMSVEPNRIIISPQNRFNAAIMLNSTFYPAVPSASAGATGSYFSINPLENIASLTVSRFVFKNDATVDGTSTAWYLIDDKKPWFVCQIRSAAEVQQEAPNAGKSFDQDVIRFRLDLRCNADHIDPRFAYQGSDGSV